MSMANVPFTIGEEYSIKGNKLFKIYTGPNDVPLVLKAGCRGDIPTIYNLKVRPDDTWVLGSPKCGNTWLQEIVWCVANDADIQTAKKHMNFDRTIFPEISAYVEEVDGEVDGAKTKMPTGITRDHLGSAPSAPSPRFFRSHLPFCLLPPALLDTCKCIYIYRDVKDAAVSLYNMDKDLPHLEGMDFSSFARDFITDQISMGPYPVSIKQAWERRHHKNLLFLYYEELVQDLHGSLVKLARFLNKQLSEEQLTVLIDHLTFKNMTNNDAVNMKFLNDCGAMKENKFMRKGIVGDYKNYFSPELEREFDEWFMNHLAGCQFQMSPRQH